MCTGGAGSGTGGSWLRRVLSGRGKATDHIKLDSSIDDALISSAATLTEGFSGRELAKLVASMQASNPLLPSDPVYHPSNI